MPVGVTTKKKITPITIGDTIFPKNIPNLNQILFNGVSKVDFNRPNIKKIKLIIDDQILISPWFNNGNNEKIKKTIKNTIPKFLLELILILFVFNFRLMKVVSSYLLF